MNILQKFKQAKAWLNEEPAFGEGRLLPAIYGVSIAAVFIGTFAKALYWGIIESPVRPPITTDMELVKLFVKTGAILVGPQIAAWTTNLAWRAAMRRPNKSLNPVVR